MKAPPKNGSIFRQYSYTPKTLCETLTVADAIFFHVIGSRADNELSGRGLGVAVSQCEVQSNLGLVVTARLQRLQDEQKTDPST